ncbi:MAG: hypothetical protein JW955_03720 [Sedimentisphaerales bacterium]|nr:hypothetical protein [Sedimentisphaerales bacterium]
MNQRATQQRWYELQQPAIGLLACLARPKIVYPIIASEPRFTLECDGFLINDKAFALPTASPVLLGCLNSRVANFYFRNVCARLEGSGKCYFEFRAQYVEVFPVPKESSVDPQKRTEMERLVEAMTRLHKALSGARTPNEKEALERQIAATDGQIDQLVYELYGLTAEEIAIVEEATRTPQ